jgi:SAM-dependent methyltransferase
LGTRRFSEASSTALARLRQRTAKAIGGAPPSPVAPAPSDPPAQGDFVTQYQSHVAELWATHDPDTAASLAVGGSFDAIGKLELACLKDIGLHPEHDVVDVGCGAGRLAVQLVDYLKGTYVGTDVVSQLLDYARQRCGRADWRFEVVDDLVIPAPDASTDFVFMFSVLTHLLHEQCYLLLEEARRALRPGGTIVASYLEFAMVAHWTVFEQMIDDKHAQHNQFVHRDDFRVWAQHLDLEVVEFRDGTHQFPIDEPITNDSGEHFENAAWLGQSTAVLRRPA